MEKIIPLLSQFDFLTFSNLVGIALFLTIGILALVLLMKLEQIKELKQSINKLMRSFHELDEQAKLIVNTDLELNRAQEQLDKRLDGLDALQKTSRLISTTLDQNEIFHRLEQPLISELGFEKNLILMFDADKKLHCRVESGFSKEEILFIVSRLEKDTDLNTSLKEGHSSSSATSPKQKKEKIIQIFDIEHFILTPILTQDGMIGIVFVGNRSDAYAVTEGDEELISIMASQIGQALENAQLFEQVYRSRQELESKIQDRTKQLAIALEEVKKVSKMKSDFISAVSHELRTPLTSIKGYASILITGKIGEIPQQVKERLEKINKHSDNLVKMINDLLDISRIESGRVEMKFTKHNVASVLENVLDILAPQIKEKGIQLKTQIDPNTPEMTVDLSQFERVFINLIGNAVKFTPLNGAITVGAQKDHNTILFSVTDTGIGIKEEDIPKLFDEFYRVENEINQNVKGTGLGLALAKNIVEVHGGQIWVTSKVNGGTTFYFTLPVS